MASLIGAAPQAVRCRRQCRPSPPIRPGRVLRRWSPHRRRRAHRRRHPLRRRRPACHGDRDQTTATATPEPHHRHRTNRQTRRAIPTRAAPEDPEVPAPARDAGRGRRGRTPRDRDIDQAVIRAYEPENPLLGEGEAGRKAGTVATLASAIVHAANMGAKVINISVTSCVSAADPLDQRAIGAAVWYAATVKDAVVIAAAGNEGEDGCAQNPAFDPLDTTDPRDWHQVKTIVVTVLVLRLRAVRRCCRQQRGADQQESRRPVGGGRRAGVGIMGLSPQTGGPVNAYPPARPGRRTCPSGAPASRRPMSAAWRRWCVPSIRTSPRTK